MKKFLTKDNILMGIGILIVTAVFITFYFIGNAHIDPIIIGGGAERNAELNGEKWNKAIDRELGIEFEYPPWLKLESVGNFSHYFKTNENVSAKIVRFYSYSQIGYGERPYCNETGNPDMSIEIRRENLREYLAQELNIGSLEEWLQGNGHKVKAFEDGRKYYITEFGVKGCNTRYTYVPLNDGRLAIFSEPELSPNVGPQDLQAFLADRSLTPLDFNYRSREAIFASIQSLVPDAEDRGELSSTDTFEPDADTPENRDQAALLGMLPRDYALKIFSNNPSSYPSATINGQKVQLFDYLWNYDWVDPRTAGLEALIDGKSVWKTEIGGLYGPDGYKFLDIDKDGTSEIEVFSDGGGNRSYTLQEYFRWTGSTFEHIDFSDMADNTPINCDNSQNFYYAPCLIIKDHQTQYITHLWTHQNREAYEKTIISNESLADWPIEARLCKKVQKVYEYQRDSGMFVKVSEQVVEENRDTLEDGVFYDCY